MRLSLLLGFLLGFLPPLKAEDAFQNAFQNWGHWRGHHGNGISETANPPVEWSETKNIGWKVEVPGRGSGSPVVWGDRVFVVSAVASDGGPTTTAQKKLNFDLFCFDRESGELSWRKTAVEARPHEGTHSTNGYASASPCTDGEHVYAHFGSRGLFCFTMEGELKWSRTDFGEMATRASFGEGSSPALAGDRIIVPWDHEGPSALFALDKETGKTLWKVDRDEPTCWATPLVVEYRGEKQVIMNGDNKARSYDLETGQEIWRCGGQTTRPVASPVIGKELVYIGSGFRGAFLGAFRLDGEGDIEGTKHVSWTVDEDTPDIASLLLTSGRLYFHKAKTGILTCLDGASGKKFFGPSRIPGVFSTYASPIAAGGHIYLTGRSGTTTVIKDSEELEIVSTNSVGETVDATPAPVGNQLFIRGEHHLFCVSE